MHKNNLRLRGLKEGVECNDLKSYIETLLTSCLGSDTEAEVKLSFAYRFGAKRQGRGSNKD